MALQGGLSTREAARRHDAAPLPLPPEPDAQPLRKLAVAEAEGTPARSGVRGSSSPSAPPPALEPAPPAEPEHGSEQEQPPELAENRGKCSECGQWVLGTQEREQNADGTYHHIKCQAAAQTGHVTAGMDRKTASAIYESTPSAPRVSTAPVLPVSANTKPLLPVRAKTKPVLPVGAKTKPLLPDGKHAFLSYQWDAQEQVKEIKGEHPSEHPDTTPTPRP